MARPRLGDSESKRLQMVITEEELAAIDDWQFANKVPSRSEAIRRLCKIALSLDEDIEALANHAQDLCGVAAWEHKESLKALHALRSGKGEVKSVDDALVHHANTTNDIFERAYLLSAIAVGIHNDVAVYSAQHISIDQADAASAVDRSATLDMLKHFERRFLEINDQLSKGETVTWIEDHLKRMLELSNDLYTARLNDAAAEKDEKLLPDFMTPVETGEDK